MNFFQTFIKNLRLDVKWLAENKNSTKKAWGYFLILVLLVSAVTALVSAWQLPQAVNELKKEVLKEIPDFSAQFKGGVLTVDKLPQPYTYRDESNKVLFVIDTTSTTALDFAKLVSEESASSPKEMVVLIAKDNVSFYQDRGASRDTRTLDFKSVPDKSFDRNLVVSMADKYTSSGMMVLYVTVGTIMLVIFTIIGKIIFVVFWSLIVLIISSIAKKGWKYGEIFNVGLMAVTWPIIIQTLVVMLVSRGAGSFPGLILLAIMLGVIFSNKPTAIASATTISSMPTDPGK